MFKNKNKKTNKKTLTYAQAHNRALRSFKKSSKIMIWGGVFNIFGLMFGLIQNAMSQTTPTYFLTNSLLANTLGLTTYQYYLCFSSNSFIFRMFEIFTYNRFENPTLPFWGFIILIMIVVLIFSGLAIFCSIYASQGNKIAFYGQLIFYFIDTIFIIINYLVGEPLEYIWIMIALHVIIWFFLVISIYRYLQLFHIEKIYKTSLIKNDTISKAEEK